MDEKTEAVKLLTARGYMAVCRDGVVLVKPKNDNTFDEISAILKESGYRYSYGVSNSVSMEVSV